MKPNYYSAKVLENYKVCNGIYKLIIEDHSNIVSGQFYMLRPSTVLLGRPISVCEVQDGKVTFLYAVVGKGTEEFKGLRSGDEIKVIGPLGNGFDENKDYGKVALVAGGIGVAPMLELSKKLRQKNNNIKMDLYAGFRDEVYLTEEISTYVDEVHIATNSGAAGIKGFVTDMLDVDKYDTVLCCGPEIMMKKVVDMCKEKGTKVYVSMEKHMACGVGACLVCTCKTKDGNKRTCKDGPVFDGYEIEL
ncbi:dihydroorotate dehydrogenase B (NAD(+)), electron transfer subunit [Clostridium polyendosporum]|uniref:Dihydroorotate dehydrogenase B (NAD(+)), electron transfer subunit n=1 Tax=Clostridium polyendosporum TaxID=69208 RepID=A0A919VHK9_9CLOT|nr:dihydroorotate dehydrogenase electron transfer subunit [Clostridium polyendosporum]GIM30495.1 dihydroorotate dehydrogenase B (NAD(+)), electron transfer subunit [Clostridium polyendosporum]